MTINQDGAWLQPSQGAVYSVVGDVVIFKAVGEDTGGKYALFEVMVQPQIGPPPHIHSREDEAFYVLEGEVEFQLDNQTIVATPETFLHSPKGQLHSFKNVGSTPARMLLWAMPAGVEKFFAEVGTLMNDPSALPAPVSRTMIERVLATAPKYGIEIIPPASDSAQPE